MSKKGQAKAAPAAAAENKPKRRVAFDKDNDAPEERIPEIAIRRLTRRVGLARYKKRPAGYDKNLPRPVVVWIRKYIHDYTFDILKHAAQITLLGNRNTISEGDLTYAYQSRGYGKGKLAYGDQKNPRRVVGAKAKAGAEATVTTAKSAPKGLAGAKVSKKTPTGTPKKPTKKASTKA